MPDTPKLILESIAIDNDGTLWVKQEGMLTGYTNVILTDISDVTVVYDDMVWQWDFKNPLLTD